MAAKEQIKLLSGYPHDAQAQIIQHSIQNDYQGLFPPKGDSHGTHQRPTAKNWDIDHDDTSWLTGNAGGSGDSGIGEQDFQGNADCVYSLEKSD